MKVENNNTLTSRLEEENYSDVEDINSIYFPDDVYDIKNSLDKIAKTAIDRIENALYSHNDTTTGFKDLLKNFLNPYFKEIEFAEACLKKSEAGLNKLRTINNDSYPNLRYIIYNVEESLVTLKTKWIPMLEEQQDKRKKRNWIVAIVIILLHIIIYGKIFYLL
jgi:hypothetical protein